MLGYKFTETASPGAARLARPLIWAVLLCLVACTTTQPKEEVVIMVDTAPPPEAAREVEAPPPPAQVPPPIVPPPSILSEGLQPVRGGAHVLPPYRGPRPCKMALTGTSPVAKACSQGGSKKAMDMMLTFVKRARAEGIVFQCADCHPDEDDFSVLAPDADAEFRKLLFLARPGD
jgi:hypothetical protein